MNIILGGTGHVGAATAAALLERGEAVTIVTRDAGKAQHWQDLGVTVAEADVTDSDALRTVLQTGKRAFLLNPPGDPSGDTEAAEIRSIEAILAALDGSGLEKIVAQSTYGAQPGSAIADLGTLHHFEQGLANQPIPTSIQRGAYYMSNFAMNLDAARDEGIVQSMFPADFVLPMVAPADLGEAAAMQLTQPVDKTGLHHVEGPRRYSIAEVAEAFGEALDRPVRVVTTPREQWEEAFAAMGFSPAAAHSYAGMTSLTLDGDFPPEETVWKGMVTIEAYVGELVRNSHVA